MGAMGAMGVMGTTGTEGTGIGIGIDLIAGNGGETIGTSIGRVSSLGGGGGIGAGNIIACSTFNTCTGGGIGTGTGKGAGIVAITDAGAGAAIRVGTVGGTANDRGNSNDGDKTGSAATDGVLSVADDAADTDGSRGGRVGLGNNSGTLATTGIAVCCAMGATKGGVSVGAETTKEVVACTTSFAIKRSASAVGEVPGCSDTGSASGGGKGDNTADDGSTGKDAGTACCTAVFVSAVLFSPSITGTTDSTGASAGAGAGTCEGAGAGLGVGSGADEDARLDASAR